MGFTSQIHEGSFFLWVESVIILNVLVFYINAEVIHDSKKGYFWNFLIAILILLVGWLSVIEGHTELHAIYVEVI